ncbi:hypothetical protein ACFQZO_11490 [Bradyrhizobium sp. GCM10027634]|uniref:hypothetical protein n=1 Tax=unclassified Bradyrhizobium TaxID=2631580 RepID=UPI00263BC6EF|nr:hypothetical protein [Bradyrhizobium sp. WYCCWR 12677]MDN5001508.1 hypothetical protein [Bradyrhizobium sp. WYCCWR 12677]
MSEIIFRADETVLKHGDPLNGGRRAHAGLFGVGLTQEAHMRRLVFAIALVAVASVGISASFAAVHQARTLTFAERFAPALPLMVNH